MPARTLLTGYAFTVYSEAMKENPLSKITTAEIIASAAQMSKIAGASTGPKQTFHAAMSRALESMISLRDAQPGAADLTAEEMAPLRKTFAAVEADASEARKLFGAGITDPRNVGQYLFVQWQTAILGATFGVTTERPEVYWEARAAEDDFIYRAARAQKASTAQLMRTVAGVYMHLGAAISDARRGDGSKARWNLGKAETLGGPVAGKLFDDDRTRLSGVLGEATFAVVIASPPEMK